MTDEQKRRETDEEKQARMLADHAYYVTMKAGGTEADGDRAWQDAYAKNLKEACERSQAAIAAGRKSKPSPVAVGF